MNDIDNIVTISHDPFARGSIVRRVLDREDRSPCQWCGQEGKFEYGWDDDQWGYNSNRIGWDGPYCSIGCYRTYNS